MESTILVIVLAIIAITIAYVIPLAQLHFVHNGWYGSTEKTESFEGGRYNPLAATQTIGSLDRLIPVDDPTGSGVNRNLRAALDTPVLTPGGGTITNAAPVNAQTSAAVPGRNRIAAAAAVCEKQSGVGTCAMLDDPAFSANCGVCIKGGSRSTDTTTGAWVGGLYMSPADQSNVAIMKIAPQPTAGACPTGSFFVDRATCEREVNRMQCADAGIAGGWNGSSAPRMDASCAQAAPAGAYIYDSKNRPFPINLRWIAPVGTGTTTVTLYRVGSDGSRGASLGMMQGSGGTELVLRSTDTVLEGDSVQLEVVQEIATHTRGTPEVYAVGRPGYNFTQGSAADLCASFGDRLATTAEVETVQGAGADWCFSGHVSDGPPVYPIQVARDGCGGPGINSWGDVTDLRGATCVGIKPAIADDYSVTGTAIIPFADVPVPRRDSQFGRIEKGVRAIVAQWENAYDDANSFATAIPLEGTVSSTTTRYGSLSSSGFIRAPHARDVPHFLSNQYWIWAAGASTQKAVFQCKIPATFLPPVYDEDVVLTAGKPLWTLRSSTTLAKPSPCGAPPYTSQCLLSLFTAAGGDGVRGQLSPTVGGAGAVQELQQQGSQDAISNYVSNLYGIATTGTNADGSLATSDVVNAASLKLFGFVIASPCEEIVTGSDGTVGLLPKEPPLSADCMNYLYQNAGSEQSQGQEEAGRKSTLKATYVSIGDRYSGLRKGEGGGPTAPPFRTCTPAGTLAPMKNGAADPAAIQKITTSTDGTIAGVQSFFNRIFQLANTDGSQDTLSACFGITLAPPDWITLASGGNWFQDSQPGARLNTIAICDDSYIVGTNVQQGIWQKSSPTGTYSQIPGMLVQIDAKSPSLCVGVGSDNKVYQRVSDGSGWIRIGQNATWASIGADGTIVNVDIRDGRLWRYRGSVDNWEKIPGIAAQIAVGDQNTMWCVNGNDQIFRWNGTGWNLIPGALSRVAVSSAGKVAGVNRQGNIWAYSTAISDWKQIPGGLTNISISETYIAGTNADGLIYYLKL